MIEQHLEIAAIFAAAGSFLEDELRRRRIAFTPIGDRTRLVDAIAALEFDVFVSNGCPHVLPVSALRRGDQRFVNVHPSLLPKLRGMHPVNGAILYDEPAGATCHVMVDAVDAGAIISQVPVGLAGDVDAGLLYQLVFLAEGEAFRRAHARAFAPLADVPACHGSYYSRRPADLQVDFAAPTADIVRRIRAFGVPTQGAYFDAAGGRIRVMSAAIVRSDLLDAQRSNYRHLEIIARYDDNLLIRHRDSFLLLERLSGDLSSLTAGDLLVPPGA